MLTRFLILLLIAAIGFGDNTDKGRKGNKRYHEKKYEEAATLFREGLEASDESTDVKVRSGLANNLGCALNRTESYEEATKAFSEAIQLASTEKELTRSAYNAGNNAFQAQDPQKSLEYYKQSMIADPTNEDARFNYEFVRRMMQQQKQSGGKGDKQQKQDEQKQDEQKDDQQQQDDEQKQDDQQQDDQKDGKSDDQKQQEEEQQKEQEQQEQQDEQGMSKEQAQQILKALQNDEEELMRQVWRMKGKPRTVDKDW